MPPRFFELHDDVSVPRRWHLKNPTGPNGREVDDPWQFTEGRPLQGQGRLTLPLEHAGSPLDFSEAGLGIPVVHVRVASVLSELAPDDVQFLPVEIAGHPEQYVLLVATRLIRCIDEKASRIRRWTQEDGIPHKVGQYRSVRGLRIDKATVGGAKVLRPEGWPGSLIVSEEIKDALQRMGATGTRFDEV